MHNGFCSVQLTRPEDRELIPECPEGSNCVNTMALHYELRRHEHIIWKESTFPSSKKVVSDEAEDVFNNNSISMDQIEPRVIQGIENFIRVTSRNPTSIRSCSKRLSPHESRLNIGCSPTVPSMKDKKMRKLLSEHHKPLLNDVVFSVENTMCESIDNRLTTHKFLTPTKADLSWKGASTVFLPHDSKSINIASCGTSHNALFEHESEGSSLSGTEDTDFRSIESDPVVKDFINNEIERYNIHKSPLVQFIDEEIQRNKNKTLKTVQEDLVSDRDSNSEGITETPMKNKSGVKVSAMSNKKDGDIRLYVTVTDPKLKLQKLEMNIPKSSSNKVINKDFFGGISKPVVKDPLIEMETKRSRFNRCPFYKRISDTSFVVDAFNYGYIPGVSIYFLSHFHRDHYIGLTSSFSKPIVCSLVTARLLRMQFHISDSYIRAFELNMERTVDGSGVTVTLLEENRGKSLPWSSMEEYPSFWDCQINKLHLDTTYCSPEYDFPAQDFVIKRTVTIVKERLRRDPNTIILVGTYTIGKERIFIAIAEALDKKYFQWLLIRLEFLSVLDINVLEQRLDARNIEFLRKYRNKFKCTSLLSIVPTGWTRESSSFKVNQKDKGIYLLEVPYSEHSSYSELKRFVQYLNVDSAASVIPTVNIGSYTSRNRLKKTFQSWIEKEETPFRKNPLIS
ncbi:DCLRE1A [Lepeophtheirus salmonis]|uniref:DCLRE1A n=1 Tax=Lepeophtheirus salmonis TaxID=72036 RepID=A0A7R8CIU4_LEPSM|nr:DCLRE1A [Lepeophtheirus salmonis]CAF2833710.1 DCLRE1A [Lepeophtheirus salmonis]